MHTAAERQYITRHQGDLDAFLGDLSTRDLLSNSLREEWAHVIRSAISLRNQLKGMSAYRADGVYKGTLINLEYALKTFLRRAGDDGKHFDDDPAVGYESLLDLQETVATHVEVLLRHDPALAHAYSTIPREIRANGVRTREVLGL